MDGHGNEGSAFSRGRLLPAGSFTRRHRLLQAPPTDSAPRRSPRTDFASSAGGKQRAEGPYLSRERHPSFLAHALVFALSSLSLFPLLVLSERRQSEKLSQSHVLASLCPSSLPSSLSSIHPSINPSIPMSIRLVSQELAVRPKQSASRMLCLSWKNTVRMIR